MREVVAFLNTNGGTIYIGVEDNGYIYGILSNKLDEVMKRISDIITTCILPNPQDLIKMTAKYEEEKWIIEVNIKKGKSLYYISKYGRSSKGCYIRVGTTCRSMSEEQIEREYIKTLSIIKESITEKRCTRQRLTFSALKTLLISKGQHINEDTFDETYSLKNKNDEYNYYAGLLEDN